MKKNNIIIIFISVISLLLCNLINTSAFASNVHDKYMLEVLFRNFRNYEYDTSKNNETNALKYACYLTIDQFNNEGDDKLSYLLNYGVKNISKNISDINYSASGNSHREATHNGWSSTSTLTNDVWNKRKQILIQTADKIFDFDGNEQKKDSFCALLYYVHILGDHVADKSIKSNNDKMLVGGKADNNDIIHELIKHIEIVFQDQKNTHKYTKLISTLQRYDVRFDELTGGTGNPRNDEEFTKYNGLSLSLIKLLSLYLPEMLKDEQFFYDVFYK